MMLRTERISVILRSMPAVRLSCTSTSSHDNSLCHRWHSIVDVRPVRRIAFTHSAISACVLRLHCASIQSVCA